MSENQPNKKIGLGLGDSFAVETKILKPSRGVVSLAPNHPSDRTLQAPSPRPISYNALIVTNYGKNVKR